MKQALIWLIPAIALTSVGSLTYATIHPDDGTKSVPKHDSNPKTKIVHFAHDAEIDTYLGSIRSYMLVPPRDNRFGASRVPTFHGRNIQSVPGYKDISSLTKDNSLVSYVVGVMPPEQIKNYQDYLAKNPTATFKLPKFRSTIIHWLDQTPRHSREGMDKIMMELTETVQTVKTKVDNEGYETYSQAVTLDGASGHIMAKAIKATDKSCYGCHTSIKEGQPIGHVIAAIWEKRPK